MEQNKLYLGRLIEKEVAEEGEELSTKLPSFGGGDGEDDDDDDANDVIDVAGRKSVMAREKQMAASARREIPAGALMSFLETMPADNLLGAEGEVSLGRRGATCGTAQDCAGGHFCRVQLENRESSWRKIVGVHNREKQRRCASAFVADDDVSGERPSTLSPGEFFAGLKPSKNMLYGSTGGATNAYGGAFEDYHTGPIDFATGKIKDPEPALVQSSDAGFDRWVAASKSFDNIGGPMNEFGETIIDTAQ